MRIHHTTAHDEKLSKEKLECEYCGDVYEEWKSREDRSRFCSQECLHNWQGETWSGDGSPRSREYPTLECEQCGDQYEVIPAREDKSRFCSRECLGKWYAGERAHAWEGGPVTVVCELCGDNFEVTPAEEVSARFCSRSCKATWQEANLVGEDNPFWQGGQVSLICEQCGDEYKTKEAREDTSRFCSRECLAQWQRENWTGENAPAWKGGRHQYYGPSWQQQRRRALERDNHQCVICGNSEVEVHHIRPFRTFGVENHSEANQLDNLICLCPDHHNEWEGIPLRPDIELG